MREKIVIFAVTKTQNQIMARALTKYNNGKKTLWRVHAAAMFAVAAWGVSFVSTRVLMDHEFTPVEVFVFRSIIAYIILLAFSRGRVRALNFRHELLFLLCGFCGGSIYFVAENAALLYTSTANVSLITSTSPLINALLVGLLYKDERPSRGIVTGSVIAMFGVSLVIFGGASGHDASTEATDVAHGLLGDTLSFMAAICWSVYAILLRKLQAFYSAVYVTRKTFFYGLITALPMLLLEPSKISLHTFTIPTVWINLLVLGLVCSSLAFLIWAWAIERIGAVKAGNYQYFQPIFTMIFGAIVLHETMTAAGMAGCAITILGVFAGEKLAKQNRRLTH